MGVRSRCRTRGAPAGGLTPLARRTTIMCMLVIGGFRIPSRILLAPLSGISDLPFRLISRGCGCDFAFIEMISARSLVERSARTMAMLTDNPCDRPRGVQLLGADPDVMRRAVQVLRDFEFDLIDVNAACPVPKVTRRGEGAGLLRDPRKLYMILESVVGEATVPVTVKIRSGWDEETVNAREVALRAEDAGVHGVIVHGRTRVQGYRGRVDYGVIRAVKEAVRLPVVASGDLLTPELVGRMFYETGCDGVAIARGSLGNPWIFQRTREYLVAGRVPASPSADEVASTMMAHLDLLIGQYGERRGTVVFRKLFAWYLRGVPGACRLKGAAFRASRRSEMAAMIAEFHSLKAGVSQPREHCPG